ncbi:hypothetical protein [Paracidovorax cattleyae]|uniref:Uncharacterized protein n=1 Tax=Paracidovorax cattleyae TaxID=80868 RepID=A0A1H0VAN7_9BURK|nr:hypothetical protein [Paracidovorax cattleyae]AVS73619.1 hypothetical protein C8240_05730 [Paracidovorax cattleyae]MBF9264367.1 hypothetical protein [Paracidovorax cattleyae]SDP75295.1 hypothetical protein SAMN04489708_12463 [Paracidovorax cattleyae]
MFNRVSGNGGRNPYATFQVSPNSSPERAQDESPDKVTQWDLPASPPRAANRPPRASAESSSSMAPRGVAFSASTRYEGGRGALDGRHVSGDGGDPKMRAQFSRNQRAAALLGEYPDGLTEALKKAVKSGNLLNSTSKEGKAVYAIYKQMMKDR